MCILSANCSQAKANCRKQWCMLLRAILSVPNGRSITRWFGTQMNFTEKSVPPTYINLYKDPRQCLRRDHLFYNHSLLLELVLKFGQWNIHHALLEIFLQMGGAFEWEMSSLWHLNFVFGTEMWFHDFFFYLPWPHLAIRYAAWTPTPLAL